MLQSFGFVLRFQLFNSIISQLTLQLLQHAPSSHSEPGFNMQVVALQQLSLYLLHSCKAIGNPSKHYYLHLPTKLDAAQLKTFIHDVNLRCFSLFVGSAKMRRFFSVPQLGKR